MLSAMRLLLCTCLLLLASLVSAGGDSRHVVLVTIDGFANFHLKDPALDLPVIRRLAAEGVEAESGETVFPSVTHPSHTTLVTGVTPRKHGVLSNRLVDRTTGEEFHVTNKPRTWMVRVPTLFDAVRAKGLTSASFFWPETKDDPAIDFNFPEVFAATNVPDRDAVPPAVLRELRDAGIDIDDYFRYYHDPHAHSASDLVLAQAAAYAIRTHRPALTAIHFLETDIVQHEVGPAHYRSRAALTAADRAVGVLVEAVEKAGLSANTTFVVTADHGFATVEHEVNVAPLFASLSDRVKLHPGGWSLYVELLPAFDRQRDGAALEQALAAALRLPGVARLVRPGEFHALGLPTHDESPYVRGHYLLIGEVDTFLTARPDSSSTSRVKRASPYHGHGYLPTHPSMHTAVVLSGRGVRKGARIGQVRSLDIAPTIARLLGVELRDVEGRVLSEALDEEAGSATAR